MRVIPVKFHAAVWHLYPSVLPSDLFQVHSLWTVSLSYIDRVLECAEFLLDSGSSLISNIVILYASTGLHVSLFGSNSDRAWKFDQAKHTLQGNPIYVFLFCELRGLSPIATFMCLWTIYIFPGSVHIFPCSRIGRPILEIYKSLTDIWV